MTAWLGSLVFLLGAVLAMRAQMADEYALKAAFLYNFAKFVEWPAQTFRTPREPFDICVLGQNPFGSALDDIVRGKTVGERSMEVRQIGAVQEARQCQILFVSSSERKRLSALFDALKGASVLTVGEMDGFAASGGVVNFKPDGERLRLEIDQEAAGRAGLRISSKLLSLAQGGRK